MNRLLLTPSADDDPLEAIGPRDADGTRGILSARGGLLLRGSGHCAQNGASGLSEDDAHLPPHYQPGGGRRIRVRLHLDRRPIQTAGAPGALPAETQAGAIPTAAAVK